jgi:putative transposase
MGQQPNCPEAIYGKRINAMSIFADLLTSNLFFVTQGSVGGEPVLVNEMMMRLMQAALAWAKERAPYERIGYVFLPDQVHLLLSPTGTATLDQIMQRTRRRFHVEYHQLLNMPGETLLWQEDYVAQRVQDVEQLALYLDAMHLLPVERGLVEQPEAWPYSSFSLWQGRGIYPPQWGWRVPSSEADGAVEREQE